MRIVGRVQGVFFRAHTQEVAAKLGLTGWVRNTESGDVEVLAEGEHANLDNLLRWCRHGPAMAQVNHVEESWEEATGEFGLFSISY